MGVNVYCCTIQYVQYSNNIDNPDNNVPNTNINVSNNSNVMFRYNSEYVAIITSI